MPGIRMEQYALKRDSLSNVRAQIDTIRRNKRDFHLILFFIFIAARICAHTNWLNQNQDRLRFTRISIGIFTIVGWPIKGLQDDLSSQCDRITRIVQALRGPRQKWHGA